jgi:hypothetical protein
MHEKALPKGSRKLLSRLERSRSPALKGWTLAGGTGLALRLGHRVSEDFDFFRNSNFDPHGLHALLKAVGSYETLQEAGHTLTVLVAKVKLSFFQVADPFLFKAAPCRFFDLADLRDIALMKLLAISSRGSRKDFVDLHTILRSGPALQDYFKLLPRKYGAGRVNAYHILRSLTYFEDAEREPLPRMLEPFNWKECKDFFVREARAVALGTMPRK